MLVANKTFPLTKDLSYTRGDPIPADVWNGLRPRTKNALKAARFVLDVPDAPVPVPAPTAKRGK